MKFPRTVLLTLLAWLMMGSAGASALTLDEILARPAPPAGVVFEIADRDPQALEFALPWVRQAAEKLKQRFPGLPMALVSHGREMFAPAKRPPGKQRRCARAGARPEARTGHARARVRHPRRLAGDWSGGGNDTYRLLWDGQGYGGVGGGVGVLADRGGDDSYFAEPDARNTPQYPYRNYAGNGQPNTNISFAQGASAGRRGDGSDGHSWPGDLGALIDVAGHDRYQAGAFAQAYGYWYGVGLMYDGAGNDTYRSVYYSLASGAHYAVSGIYDEAGDDSYIQEQTIPLSTAGAGVVGQDHGSAGSCRRLC